MTHLRTLLTFLASPPEKQIELLGHLPEDRGSPDYYSQLEHNPLLILERAFIREAVRRDEPESDFIARTGLPENTSHTALAELVIYSRLFGQSLDFENYWSKRALRQKTEWMLYRRLARQTISDLGWSMDSCCKDAVQQLIQHYRRYSE